MSGERPQATAVEVECRCALPADVRYVSGFHVQRLNAETARDLIFRRYMRRQPQPVKREALLSIQRLADEESKAYIGTQIALAPCPTYVQAEASRSMQARQRNTNSGRTRKSTFEE